MKGSHAKRKKKKCPFKSLQTINPSRDSASYNNNETKPQQTKQNKTKAHKTNGKKTHSTKQHSCNGMQMQCDAHTKPNQTKLNFNYGNLFYFPLH
jgi:hypothetical protein